MPSMSAQARQVLMLLLSPPVRRHRGEDWQTGVAGQRLPKERRQQ
jgi:hypothetical protein